MNRRSAISSGTISLLIARIIYAINWFNIGSLFPFISKEFNQDVSYLGQLSGFFLLGIGLFQIPGGLFATKFGSRRSAILGILLSSIAVIISSLTTQIAVFVILRFIVGLGMAFFFSAGVTLITTYLGKRSEGTGIGLLNSFQAIGGIIGIFGWILVAEVLGWRLSLIMSGILGVAIGLTMIFLLPVETQIRTTISISLLRKLLFSRYLVSLGVILTATQLAWGLTVSFFVFYLIDRMKISPEFAGIISSIPLVVYVFTSPITGKIYDKSNNSKWLLLIFSIMLGISIMMNSLDNLTAVILSAIFVGFFATGGFTIIYAITRKIESTTLTQGQEYATLNVSWINGISLMGISWVPVVFSLIINQAGYSIAWFIGGAITLILTIPILALSSRVFEKTRIN
ncbi:MAG TPA: MFS transporter [Nitrososphaeraceae archaeon]|jgi:MFS family permease|nr:MFS transporter [Nitrososphaeraceae archaeon]